jgi:hypothetical protein
VSIEPGRWVADDGRVVYAWPPEGRFVKVWSRLHAAFSDDEKHDVLALLLLWRDENSTLVAYADDDGEWVDVEPDWDVPGGWVK